MLLVVGAEDRARHDAALRAMFAARKRVFIDLLKWDLPVLAGCYELDQFDNVCARYLILTDSEGRHMGSARLLETTRPHILDTLFSDLCVGEIPRDASVFEITRFCLDRDLTAAERRVARNQLVSALAEYALHAGITAYTGVAEMGWLQQILAFGWQCMPLGLPRKHGRRLLGALRISIDDDTTARLHAAGTYVPIDIAMGVGCEPSRNWAVQ